MTGDISIDVGSAVPYAIERVLGFFGKDSLSVAAKSKLEERTRRAALESAAVQSVGMSQPVPLELIYQSTSFRLSEWGRRYEMGSTGTANSMWMRGGERVSRSANNISKEDVLASDQNSVVWGPPGSGKSMFFRFAYRHLLRSSRVLPLLFILRQKNAVSEIQETIQSFQDELKGLLKGRKVCLLLDGYDELTIESRKEIAKLLKQFAALNLGYFVISCRTYYELIDIVARQVWIEPFTPENAKAYIGALSKAFEYPIDEGLLMDELSSKGFSDFMQSPLMLTLVCILKMGSMPSLPSSSIGLIGRAIDTLTFRWDESRGIHRSSDIDIDGEPRIKCLMRIAHAFPQPIGSELAAIKETERFLKLLQRSSVNARRFLTETARFYGLFVPVEEGSWTFTHRTVHDFLAARQWVEDGRFSHAMGTIKEWNARVAYAACLCPNATTVICRALTLPSTMMFVLECFTNGASFDVEKVALALIKRFDEKLTNKEFELQISDARVLVSGKSRLAESMSDDLLRELLSLTSEGSETRGRMILYVIARIEVERRKLSIYKSIIGRRMNKVLALAVDGEKPLTLHDLSPFPSVL